MSTASHSPSLPGRLSVRVHRIPDSHGSDFTRSHVFCPDRQAVLRLAECIDCQHYGGLAYDRERPGHSVLCLRFEPESPTRARERGGEVAPTPDGGPRVAQTEAHSTAVAAIMTRGVVTVPDSLSLETLLWLFVDRDISGAPVVDKDGRLVGVVSKSDLVREVDGLSSNMSEGPNRVLTSNGLTLELGQGFQLDELAELTVDLVMTPTIHSLPPEASIAQAAELMADKHIHRLPIITSDGRLVGIVSTLDVLRWLAAPVKGGTKRPGGAVNQTG